MNFSRVRLQNFLCWKRLDVDLENRGLVFLHGANGSGKTAIFDSIEWCLYKQISKKIPISEIVRNGSKRGCFVTVWFSTNGSNYQVTRYRSHPKFGDKLIIIRDGKDITPSTNPDAESRLKGIIKLSRSAFNNSILFSEESEFYFSAFSDAKQKSVLRELLDLTILNKCRKISDENLDVIDTELMVVQEKVHASDSEIAYLESKIKKQELERKENQEKVKGVVKELDERFVVVGGSLLSVRKRLRVAEKHLSDWVSGELTLRENIRQLKEGELVEHGSCSVCSSSLVCPSCLESSKKKKDDKEVRESVKSAQAALKRVRKRKVGGRRKVAVLRRKEGRYLKEREQLVVKKRLLMDRAFKEDDGKDGERLDLLQRQRESCQDRLGRLQRKRYYYEFWHEGFGRRGAELFALRQILPVLNDYLKSYLSVLFPKLTLEYGIDESGKIEHKLSMRRGAYRVGGLSKGQKRRIDLSVGLALQDTMASFTGVQNNLLLADEVFENLDPSGIKKAMSLLRGLGEKRSTIFVISHRSMLRKFFSNTMEVQQEKEVSYLT